MKTGLITGVGKGIGNSTLKLLIKKKYKIITITKSKNKVIENILKNKQVVKNYYHELGSDIEKDRSLIREICKNNKINFLICNAGIRHRSSISNMDVQERNKTLQTNYISSLTLVEEVIKNFKNKNNAKKDLNIVYVSSIVGNYGFKDLSSYAASKMAMEGFMKSAAVEFAKKSIRINIIAPGFIKTSYHKKFLKNQKQLNKWILNRTPMGRWGNPEEVSNVIEFLISEKSSYITGSTIFVDGGWNIA